MKIILVRWRHKYFYFYDNDLDNRRQTHTRLVMGFSSRQDAEIYCAAIASGEVPLPTGINPFIGFRGLRRGYFTTGVHREYVDEDQRFFGIKSLSSMTELELLTALDKLQIARPSPPSDAALELWSSRRSLKWATEYFAYDWDEWWETTAVCLADWQRHSIIKLLDKVQLFEIVETDLEM